MFSQFPIKKRFVEMPPPCKRVDLDYELATFSVESIYNRNGIAMRQRAKGDSNWIRICFCYRRLAFATTTTTKQRTRGKTFTFSVPSIAIGQISRHNHDAQVSLYE